MMSQFLSEQIVDPLSKSNLKTDFDELISDYGRKYKIINGVADLRVQANNTSTDQKKWLEGQEEYVEWNSHNYLTQDREALENEKKLNAAMYTDINFEGKNILDVGGNAGLFREFASLYKNFVIIDPYENALTDAQKSKNLKSVYPFLDEYVDFVIGHAENLPFRSNVFDVVHMRSVIDHFLNPELALHEAYRVMKHSGVLIIGVSLEKFDSPALSKIKKILKNIGLIKPGHDHHSWHPNIENLRVLCTSTGFKITDERYQDVLNANIVYIRAEKE
jgi:ubiquinone/menaquinone biosynthesis C-methylase UbiE